MQSRYQDTKEEKPRQPKVDKELRSRINWRQNAVTTTTTIATTAAATNNQEENKKNEENRTE